MQRLGLIFLFTLLPHACVFADTIWIAPSAGGNALELKNIKITGISEGKLLFQSAGRDSNRDLAVVLRMQMDDEPAFSLAEEAFAAGKLDIATQAYQTALQATRKPWLKARINARLAQVTPKPAAAAQPAPQTTVAAPAAPQVAQVPAAAAAVAKVKLDAAAAALAKKDFQGAMTEIHLNRPAFTDSASQAQALFYLADAEAGLAASKSDAQSWQDVALAYMRVAAHFPESPLTPRALMTVAQIEQQKLNDPTAARSIYEQIAKQYPNDPAATTAKEQLR